ncbi:MAG: heparan-alpha-glucosaminide N-acetyltransferase domain-containing protein, partial [Kangiellaceae bacterium]|nr:heparan-alpha-glucosaminide N-acetyltransferase domain-containing protein [Kangiellaceae bacterium]
YIVLFIAFLICMISREVSGLFTDSGFGYLFKLLWAADFQVYFPIFPWFACILFGQFFGIWYRELKQENSSKNSQSLIFNKMALSGLPMIFVGVGLMWFNFEYHFNDFFHLGPGGAIYLSGLNFVLLWLIFRLTQNGAKNWFVQLLKYASERVTSLYVIQWTLICWGMGIVGFQQMSSTQVMVTIPALLFVTFVAQVGLEGLVGFFRNSNRKLSTSDAAV